MSKIELNQLKYFLGTGLKICVSHKTQPDYITDLTLPFLGDATGIKPILYPLSHFVDNAKKFDDPDSDTILMIQAIENDDIESLRHDLFMEMVENKYDVFNWIPEGLAIDVLTLENNPYA